MCTCSLSLWSSLVSWHAEPKSRTPMSDKCEIFTLTILTDVWQSIHSFRWEAIHWKKKQVRMKRLGYLVHTTPTSETESKGLKWSPRAAVVIYYFHKWSFQKNPRGQDPRELWGINTWTFLEGGYLEGPGKLWAPFPRPLHLCHLINHLHPF